VDFGTGTHSSANLNATSASTAVTAGAATPNATPAGYQFDTAAAQSGLVNTTNGNQVAGNVLRVDGFQSTKNNTWFDTNNSGSGVVAADLNSNNNYWSVTISSNGDPINVDSIAFDFAFTSTRRGWGLAYVVDGGSPVLIGSAINGSSGGNQQTSQYQPIMFSNLGITDATSVEFRWYMFANQVGSRVIHFDNVTFTGSVIPEPGSLVLAGLGAVMMFARRRRVA
jgi:hypothetical protein